MIPNAFIQDLLARVDIVEVVDRYVPLKKAGANYSALLPVPQREDAVVHRQPDQAVLPLLRLRRARHGDRLPDGVRRQSASSTRSRTRARRRHGGAARSNAPSAARAARRSASDLYATLLDGRAVLPRAAEGRAARHRLPQAARPHRRDRRALRHRLRARRLAEPRSRVPRLRRPGAARAAGLVIDGDERQALRPVPRPHHVPDRRCARPGDRLRRARARRAASPST